MMNRRQLLAVSTAFSVGLGLPAGAATPLDIVATTGMIADAATAVGGDLVSVTALMGPGVDPHAYRQTRSDILALTRADLVLWHGLFLEAQMEDLFQKLADQKPVTAVAETLPADQLLAHDDYETRSDPHIWMDPALWRDAVTAVAMAIADLLPDQRDIVLANAEAYRADIDAVGTYSKDVLSTVPAPNRVLITAHDAFNYFGRAYGFDVVGIQGISTESEAGLSQINALVDLLVEREIGAVFVESSVSDRNIRALIEGAGARGHRVAIGGELFSDAMGPPGTYEGSYIGMIDHNATVIAGALGGSVPERGMSGKLSFGS